MPSWVGTRQAVLVSSSPARVLNFNIGRGAVGPRWGASPPGATFERLDEVAEVVARTGPELVALQEVHEGDVPELLRLLDRRADLAFDGAFAPALPAEHPKLARLPDPTRRSPFGLALLSASPITPERVVPLPSDGKEDRVAQVAAPHRPRRARGDGDQRPPLDARRGDRVAGAWSG